MAIKPNQSLKAYRPAGGLTPFSSKTNVSATPKQPASPKAPTLKRPTIVKTGGFQKSK